MSGQAHRSGAHPKIPDSDLEGRRFGKLVILSVFRYQGKRLALALCDCGRGIERETREFNAKTRGCSKSCAHSQPGSSRQQKLRRMAALQASTRHCIICKRPYNPQSHKQVTCLSAGCRKRNARRTSRSGPSWSERKRRVTFCQ